MSDFEMISYKDKKIAKKEIRIKEEIVRHMMQVINYNMNLSK